MPYTTSARVNEYIGKDHKVGTSVLDSWILAIDNWINTYVGMSFKAVSEQRFYDGDGSREAIIDPFSAITEVLVLDIEGNTDSTLAEGASNDYLLYPLNDTIQDTLQLTAVAAVGGFPNRSRSLAVTGVFGFADGDRPEEVTLAATMLLAQIIEKSQRGGKTKSEKIGEYSVTYHTIDEIADSMAIKNILDQFRVIPI